MWQLVTPPIEAFAVTQYGQPCNYEKKRVPFGRELGREKGGESLFPEGQLNQGEDTLYTEEREDFPFWFTNYFEFVEAMKKREHSEHRDKRSIMERMQEYLLTLRKNRDPCTFNRIRNQQTLQKIVS